MSRSRRRRRKGSPTEMGTVLPKVLDELGLHGASAALRVSECWESVVGKETAAHCTPVGMRGSVLEAAADSSVWCQHVQWRSPEILAGLKEAMGDAAPSAMRLHVSG